MNPQPPEDASPADDVGGPEFTSCRAVAGGTRTIYTYHLKVEPPRYQVEHDRERRVFRVTGPDGTSAAFRDQPVRFLVVQPDPRTAQRVRTIF